MILFLCQIVQASDLMERLSSTILSEARVELSNILDEKSLALKIEHLGIDAKTTCENVEKIQVSFRSDEDFQGPIQVSAKLYDKVRLCQEWSFRTRIAVTANLPVAASSVPALTEIPIEMRSMRYDKINGTILSVGKEPLIARTALKKFQPITAERVKRKPLNYDGDMVELILVNQNLEIRAKGKLMSDAQMGDRVRVLSLSTSTVLEGVLVQKDAVEIGRRIR